ncbi:hypothetical protein Fcan01_27016, partial [Folsomia candida]
DWYPNLDLSTSKWNTYTVIFFKACIVSTFLGYLATTWLYFVFPDMPPFPGDLFPPQIYYYYLSYLVFGLFYPCYLFMAWSTLLFALCLTFAFVACLTPVLTSDFRGDRAPAIGQNIEQLRHLENLTRVYRQVELLHKLFLENYAFMLVPVQSLVGQYGLICNYSLISQWNEMDDATKVFLLTLLVISQVTWYLFLTLSGWFYDNSVKVLKSWKALGVCHCVEVFSGIDERHVQDADSVKEM